MDMKSAECSLIMVQPDSGWKDYLKRIQERKKKGFKRGWK